MSKETNKYWISLSYFQKCTKKIEILIVIDWSKLFSDKSDEGAANWIFKSRASNSLLKPFLFGILHFWHWARWLWWWCQYGQTEVQYVLLFLRCPEGGIDRLPMGTGGPARVEKYKYKCKYKYKYNCKCKYKYL